MRKFCFSNRDATLQDILTRGKLIQDVEYQSKELACHADVNIKNESEDVKVLSEKLSAIQEQINQIHSPDGKKNIFSDSKPKTCFNCGNAWPHHSLCPAKDKICRNCGKRNHFARVCRGTTAKVSARHARPLNFVNNDFDDSSFEYVNSHVFNPTPHVEVNTSKDLFTIEEINAADNTSSKLTRFRTTIFLEGRPISCLIDTGCSTNILNLSTYNYLQKLKHIRLKKSKVALITYGANEQNSNIHTLGIIHCLAESNNRFAEAEFFVVNTKATNLIGGNLALQLNLLTLHINNVDTREQISMYNDHKEIEFEDQLNKIPNRVRDYIRQYGDVFKGIGRFRGDKIKLHINKTVKPVAQKPRRIPFNLRQKVETELVQLKNADIIEDVTGEPTPWVSPIVVVRKNKDPNQVRLCIDMRQANKAIERTRYPLPCLDDLIQDLNGSNYFCKLDMNKAFLQFELDEASRYITTFATHKGLHRFKCLNFGTSSASEELQQKIEHVLHGIENCKNIADDILLFAKTKEELDRILLRVLQRFSEFHLTLNLQKCEFHTTRVEFFGLIFSSQGISPSMDKVKAINALTPPTNLSELRSFLGMTNFLSRFIPKYSEICSPLLQLTKKDVPWNWGVLQQQSFERLKLELSSGQVMTYFNPAKAITLVTDAGPAGLSAILMQHTPDKDDFQVVAYSSRTLTDVEKRYSQLEKECLGILHGCEKFRLYLLGGSFTILTDHKPLVSLLNKPSARIPLRIERWSLRLQDYDFNIQHIKGEFNPADYCSRHTIANLHSVAGAVTEAYVNFVIETARPTAVTLTEIYKCTEQDRTLQALITLIHSNNWHALDKPDEKLKDCNLHDLRIYRQLKHELTVTSDQSMILRLNRIVIPSALQNRMIALGHENHLGITKTKSLLRDKIYFPGMDAKVAAHLSGCLSCIATSTVDPPPPLQPSPLPPSIWHTLNMDFVGPFPNQKYLLVVIDQYSRYPEVEIVSSTDAQHTINALTKIFATHGLPYKIISDNGPPYTSTALKLFMRMNDIIHHRITPLHPKANSSAENFMRNLNKTLRTAVIDRTPWILALYQFLHHYRSVAHSTTQISPAEVLFKRKLRLKIPAVNYEPNTEALKNLPNRDAMVKAHMKDLVDKRYHANTKPFVVGDYVLVRQQKRNKLSSRFDPKPYRIALIKGTMISAHRPGHTITRNIQHFKYLSQREPQIYRQGGDNDDDEDDYDDIVTRKANEVDQPLVEPRNGIQEHPKRYPTRERKRPEYLHEQYRR